MSYGGHVCELTGSNAGACVAPMTSGDNLTPGNASGGCSVGHGTPSGGPLAMLLLTVLAVIGLRRTRR
jgi:MYXO-CTERM domain-containing protein